MRGSWIDFKLNNHMRNLSEVRDDRFVNLLHPISTLNLIERVYREFPLHSKLIIRNRIFTSEAKTRMLQDLIRVGAKRYSICESESFPRGPLLTDPLLTDPLLIDIMPSEPRTIPISGLSWSEIQMGNLSTNLLMPKHTLHRNVGAALYIPQSHTIKIFRNQNQLVKTWHAEMLLLRAYQYALPEDSILFTTLKPCRMCAAWILGSRNADSVSKTHFKVVYLENDEGRLGRNTALDECSDTQLPWELFKLENPGVSSLFSDGDGEPARSIS